MWTPQPWGTEPLQPGLIPRIRLVGAFKAAASAWSDVTLKSLAAIQRCQLKVPIPQVSRGPCFRRKRNQEPTRSHSGLDGQSVRIGQALVPNQRDLHSGLAVTLVRIGLRSVTAPATGSCRLFLKHAGTFVRTALSDTPIVAVAGPSQSSTASHAQRIPRDADLLPLGWTVLCRA